MTTNMSFLPLLGMTLKTPLDLRPGIAYISDKRVSHEQIITLPTISNVAQFQNLC